MKKALPHILFTALFSLLVWQAFAMEGSIFPEEPEFYNFQEQPSWELKVYPNPVRDMLVINSTLPEKTDLIIEIRDITGKKVREEKLEELSGVSENTLNLSNLREGIYFLKFYSADKKYYKIIKIQKL
jgi:hypothetical protein